MKPAISSSFVTGMKAWAMSKWSTSGSPASNGKPPSSGKANPSELSNGSPEFAANRPSTMSCG